jgi:hypothetical protein
MAGARREQNKRRRAARLGLYFRQTARKNMSGGIWRRAISGVTA